MLEGLLVRMTTTAETVPLRLERFARRAVRMPKSVTFHLQGGLTFSGIQLPEDELDKLLQDLHFCWVAGKNKRLSLVNCGVDGNQDLHIQVAMVQLVVVEPGSAHSLKTID
jgi:hypothetical protein